MRIPGIPRTPEGRRSMVFTRALTAGIGLVLVSAFFLRQSFTLLRRGEHGSGSVVAIDRGRHGRSRPRAVIRVFGGRSEGMCRLAAGDLAPGTILPMTYLAEDPSVCQRDDLRALLGVPGLGFAVGVTLTLGSLVWLLDRRGTR